MKIVSAILSIFMSIATLAREHKVLYHCESAQNAQVQANAQVESWYNNQSDQGISVWITVKDGNGRDYIFHASQTQVIPSENESFRIKKRASWINEGTSSVVFAFDHKAMESKFQVVRYGGYGTVEKVFEAEGQVNCVRAE